MPFPPFLLFSCFMKLEMGIELKPYQLFQTTHNFHFIFCFLFSRPLSYDDSDVNKTAAPELYIADENQNPLYERHYEVNSTLELYCYVNNINIESMSHVVTWSHNEHVLNYDAVRGGVR